ncbi:MULTISPECIES: DUF6221 family protein [unclassified Streptomyces]|uniref:DUF6221 family protein n=1 Tax=unclassified Streptomyces TaxID=2593676 RepID=UPI000DD5323B|nr:MULTISPECIES: DUF6221 family protein [unclassified Streptomyces]QZZ26551.1 hypothetical protein A7X85_10040 [Streptomyces sp. ST1015]
MDLVEFVRARLDEDAELARSGETWTAFDEAPGVETRRVDVDHSFERVVACTRSWRALHIAEHDPARVLREVDAKRMNLSELEASERDMDQAVRDGDTARYNALRSGRVALAGVVRRDATAWADHPDYREEWAP